MDNLPNLSNRARQALDVLADGGQFAYRLERNRYTGREQWEYRLLDTSKNVVRGIGRAAFRELEAAGMLFLADSFSVATYYGLRNGRSEHIAQLRRIARGPADGFEYAGWEADAARAKAELDRMTNT
jgi:hypothetical protein